MEFDPLIQTTSDDPHPVYAWLRDEDPLHFCAKRDMFVLSRHADVVAAVKDPETFASGEGIVPSGFKPDEPTIIVMDPPAHTAMRKHVMRAFTPRRMEGMIPRVRQIARELVADWPEEGVLDAFERFTDPLPIAVMAELLGVDASERPLFKRCGDAIVYSSGADPGTIHAAQRELEAYLEDVFERRRRAPGGDLISLLLFPSEDGAALSQRELLGLCFTLLVAGTETTTSALGNALWLLERHPELKRWLAEDPARIPAAVEEILRYESPVQGLSRVVRRDVTLHGRTIPKGARVHLLWASANRDPRAFPDADRFDPTRSPNNHVAFGFGIHFCLGASLARTELRIGLEELLARAPDFRLDTAGLRRLPSDTNRGFGRLPIEVGVDPRAGANRSLRSQPSKMRRTA
ncbi:MAG: cytochrome P450 [Myxococcota bacterium]